MFTRPVSTIMAGAAIALLSVPAIASPNLVTNGSFSNSTAYYGSSGANILSGAPGSTTLPGWGVSNALNPTPGQNASQSFTFLAPTASLGTSTTGGTLYYLGSPISLYNGPGATPDNGTAITSDANNLTAAIYQTVSGLTVGQTYTLSFYQATMQATDGTGNFTAAWNVYFGTGGAANAQTTPTVVGSSMYNPSQSYSAWNQDTLTLTATAASETLSFFATANANNTPPFLLLDGVSLTANAGSTSVPEPATLSLAVVGLAGLVVARRRRRATDAA